MSNFEQKDWEKKIYNGNKSWKINLKNIHIL